MPLTGKELATGQLVDITETAKVFKTGDCICPFCEQIFVPKYGPRITSHFAHLSGAECSNHFGKHPESPEHDHAKWVLSSLLKIEGAEVFKEYPVNEARRIADILAIYPNGLKMVHEIQLSTISTESLESRTRSYHKAELGVSWWLGKDANISRHHQTLNRLLGYSIEIELPFTEDSKKLIRYIKYENDVPVVIKTPYPFLIIADENQAEWFKFVGTHGKITMGKIIGRKDQLIQVKRVNDPDHPFWTYRKPKKGMAVFGNLNRDVIYAVA